MSFSGLGAVGRPHEGLPVGDGVVASQSHSDDRARAHEGSQAGEEELSILVCVEVTALLWTELQLPLLSQKLRIARVSEM